MFKKQEENAVVSIHLRLGRVPGGAVGQLPGQHRTLQQTLPPHLDTKYISEKVVSILLSQSTYHHCPQTLQQWRQGKASAHHFSGGLGSDSGRLRLEGLVAHF